MSKELITIVEDQDVEEAAKLMQSKQIRRVPVLSRDKRLVGMLSLGDLAQRAQDSKLAGKTLEQRGNPRGSRSDGGIHEKPELSAKTV